MFVTNDARYGLSYIYLAGDIPPKGVGRTIQASPTINLDLDHEGHLIGIELLDRQLLHPRLRNIAIPPGKESAARRQRLSQDERYHDLIRRLRQEAEEMAVPATAQDDHAPADDRHSAKLRALLEEAAQAIAVTRAAADRDLKPTQPVTVALPFLNGTEQEAKEGAIIPLVIRRVRDDDKGEPNLFLNARSGHVFSSELQARQMRWYQSDAYRAELKRRVAASRLVNAAIVEATDDPICDPCNDEILFPDDEELLEKYEEGKGPSYAFCTTAKNFDLDLEGVLGGYLNDEHPDEEYSSEAWNNLVDPDEIMEAFQRWSKKQTLKSWIVDYTRIIVLNAERFQQDLEAARATLAEPPGVPTDTQT